MGITEEINNFYVKAKQRHDNGLSWREICEDYYKKFGEWVTVDGIRKRVKRASVREETGTVKFSQNPVQTKQPNEFVQHNADGTIEATKTVLENISEYKDNADKLLGVLGYDSSNWDLVSWRISQWDGGVGGAPRFAIQYKVKPKSSLSEKDLVAAVKEAFKDNIEPIVLKNTDLTTNKRYKLMEIPPIELHLGKIADTIECGEEYTLEIAQARFDSIVKKILEKQARENCSQCLVVVGGDFFNAESDYATSVHKIPQQNSHGYIKLFSEGLKMYSRFILSLAKAFDKVDVMLCAGNHARAMETFLYFALQNKFDGTIYDGIVRFIDNYKQTQCYCFGNNAIFYNHGDANLKQLIKSIPAEFNKEWGTHEFRELHLGHLHKEMTVDDDGGMITRRIGSPCSTDAWHAQNRFVGAVKKHEIFIWDAKYGLDDICYIKSDC